MGAEGAAAMDFATLERSVRRIALKVVGRVLQSHLNTTPDECGEPALPCHAGAVTRPIVLDGAGSAPTAYWGR